MTVLFLIISVFSLLTVAAAALGTNGRIIDVGCTDVRPVMILDVSDLEFIECPYGSYHRDIASQFYTTQEVEILGL